MNKALKIGIIAMALFGWSCGASGQSTYTEDMVRDAKVRDATLHVAVPSETAYFMAGAKIIKQSQDEIVLKLIRCKFKKSCDVDIRARYNRETGFNEMPVPSHNIRLDFEGQVSEVLPIEN